jgi:CheY-like chemotaxis protein
MSANQKILLVDDDKDFVESIKIVLEDDGYEVIPAYDGEEGLEKAKRTDPDVIVLDIMMRTTGEGMYVAQDLRRDEATKNIPIIVVTAINAVPPYSLWKDEAWLPVDVFMEKPVLPGVLLEEVRKILGKPRTRTVHPNS